MDTSENHTDTSAAIDAALAATEITKRIATVEGDHGLIHVAVDGEGNVRVLQDVHDLDDERAPSPPRRKGTLQLDELDSYVEYVNRYKGEDAVAWADADRFAVTTVFNEHPPGSELQNAGFRDHRAIYTCPRSQEWIDWTSKDGKAMSQAAFGDWIEAHLDDLAGPNASLPDFPQPTQVLEMARKLSIITGSKYKREINPTTGEGTLVAQQEHTQESTKIPRAFLLKIPVFQGGTAYYVEARVRFALNDQGPSFTYLMHNRLLIERDAFGEVRAAVASRCSVPVLAGKVG
jgi:uncharacterized protein YfdQ (DUF2303 family)